MILQTLRVQGWRNLVPAEVPLGARVSVFFGHNGQGKTNLLEAAYYLVAFRSFRSTSTSELLSWGSSSALLEAKLTFRGLERVLRIEIGSGRKSATLDGKGVRRDSAALEGTGVELFAPEDLRLPKAAAAERRRFLDRAVFGCFRPYYREALAFERALKSRNVLLRVGDTRPALLDAYDEKLSQAGARVIMRRRALVQELSPRFSRLFEQIHSDAGVTMRYRSAASVDEAGDEEGVVNAIRMGLLAQREQDRRRGFTGFGPQTDDLELGLAGRPAREHGSQGQLRSLVLALKLAELENQHAVLGEPPLLLLDDVASELDEERRGRLFETIASLTCQTLITVTEREHLPMLPERLDFEVTQGSIRPC